MQLTGGKAPEVVKQELLSLSPAKLQPFMLQLQSFLFYFLFGLIFVVLIVLLSLSLSRTLVWKFLLGQTFSYKPFLKWNFLNLIMTIFVVIYTMLILLTNLIITFLFSLITSNSTFLIYFSKFFNYLFLIFFLILIFLIHYSFAHKVKIWESIGSGFHLMAKKWSALWRGSLLILATAILIGIILFPIAYFLSEQALIIQVVAGIFTLLFLSWMRIYLLQIMQME